MYFDLDPLILFPSVSILAAALAILLWRSNRGVAVVAATLVADNEGHDKTVLALTLILVNGRARVTGPQTLWRTSRGEVLLDPQELCRVRKSLWCLFGIASVSRLTLITCCSTSTSLGQRRERQ